MTEMIEPVIVYDEPADVLYMSFAPGKDGTGLDLNDYILLRVDKRNRRAVGLTLIGFSLLPNGHDGRPRTLPLTGFEELSPELRQLAIEVVQAPPINKYLTITPCSPSGAQAIPSVTVNTEHFVAHAA